MAKYYFGASNPIGRRIGFGRGNATDIEIVGVVRDIRNQQLRDAPVRFLYIPYAQDDSVTQLTFYVRAAGDPSAAAVAVRQTVQRLDPNLPIADMKTMEAQVGESLFVERMVAGAVRRFRSAWRPCSPPSASTGSWPTPWLGARARSGSGWPWARSAAGCCAWC